MAEANMHLKTGEELIAAQKRLGIYKEEVKEDIKSKKEKKK